MTTEMIETGDKTYADRLKRYEYVLQRLSEPNAPTYEQLGRELGISKQAVSRMVTRGVLRPSGRPRSNEGRRKRLVARIEKWQARRLAKMGKKMDVAYEDANIAKLEAQLADFSS
jgi:hypothetical protein